MKFWDSFRNYFYQRTLRRKLATLQVKGSIMNLEDARQVGILFDYSRPDNETAVLSFANELRSKGKEVVLLGYTKKKETVAKDSIILLRHSDVTWTLVPDSEDADLFAVKKFDLLLCLSTRPVPPLEFVACISHARWRVGAYSPDKTHCYDLMIQLEAGKTVADMIEQTKNFLNQIHYDSKQA